MKKIISSEQIPKPIGPYSTAVISDSCLYTSGQIALDKTTFELINGTMKEQTLIVLDNIDSILTEIGISKQSILKLTVYVTDLSQFNEVNDAFKLFFENFDFPARTTIEVAGLPLGASVEIDCIASIK
jgi:2-iminobutanoate/2-iminopropanoate deaminase